MKRFLALFFIFLSSLARANVPCALPYQLQNATIADATQVMANYNAIVQCLANAAAAGANSDITALLGLTTPVAPGGTLTFYGGVSAGIVNAQVLTNANLAQYTLTTGYKVRFQAGFTNTGPLTLNVQGTGVKNVLRWSGAATVALAGGDIISGELVEVLYDGTQYILLVPTTGLIPVGMIADFGGTTAPLGWLTANGTCASQVTYAALFAQIGASYGTCGAGLFALPYLNGRVTAGYDQQGGVTAGVLTTAGGCNATTVGVLCGAQTQTLANANLPLTTPTFTGTLATITSTPAGGGAFFASSGTPSGGGSGGSSPLMNTIGTATTTYTPAGTISSFGTGSPTAVPVLTPLQTVLKAIKY